MMQREELVLDLPGAMPSEYLYKPKSARRVGQSFLQDHRKSEVDDAQWIVEHVNGDLIATNRLGVLRVGTHHQSLGRRRGLCQATYHKTSRTL